MNILIISPKNRTVYNFRGDLIRKLLSNGHDVIVTGPNKDEINKVLELGVKFIEVPLEKTGLNVISDLKYFLQLRKIIKEYKPQKILAYTIKPVIYGGLASRVNKNTESFVMITGLGYVYTSETFKAKIIRKITNALYKLSFSNSKAIIFQNPDDLEQIKSLKLSSSDKFNLVNGSGVNMSKYTPTKYPETLTFFMLSRVMTNKGVNEYLNAAKYIKQKYPNTKFILLGAIEDSHDSLTEQYVQSFVSDNIIEYYGETDDVTAFYSKSSVYVLPSYREGTPRTVLEAMSMRRPIITTNTPGCKETVIDGYNGYLVPPKDSESLRIAMEKFIHNPELVSLMGENSFNYCKEKFEVNIINSKMVEIMNL